MASHFSAEVLLRKKEFVEIELQSLDFILLILQWSLLNTVLCFLTDSFTYLSSQTYFSLFSTWNYSLYITKSQRDSEQPKGKLWASGWLAQSSVRVIEELKFCQIFPTIRNLPNYVLSLYKIKSKVTHRIQLNSSEFFFKYIQICDPFFASHLMSLINNSLISLQEELTHMLSRKEVCLWERIVSEQKHNRGSDKVRNIQTCSRNTSNTWVKNPLVFREISVKKKPCLFSSFCYCGHLNKDSIFLLEPSSTAVKKKSCHLH